MPLIGLAGPAGAGKSTVAAILKRRYGARVVPFAQPLKRMLRSLGVPHASLYGADKERPLDVLCGRSARHAMQTLGTQWGRECIDANLWLVAWAAAVNALPAGSIVIADDLRFPNEAALIKASGGLVLRVARPGLVPIAGSHASETADFPADATVINNTSVRRLAEIVVSVVEPLIKARDGAVSTRSTRRG